MPNYDIRNKETGEVTEKFMTIAALEIFLTENPQFEVAFLQSRIGDPFHLGVQKVPSDFIKYVLEPIHRRNGSKKEIRSHAPREI
jgi:hypothetical protein